MPVAKIGGTSEVKKVNIRTLLEPGELGAMLDLQVWDPKIIDPKTGKPQILEQRSMKSESYVQQFLQLMFIMCGNVFNGLANVRDTSNVLRTARNPRKSAGGIFNCSAGAATVTHGIIIGTGNTAPVITNYVIETIIPHATMNYSAMTFGTHAADATTSQITLTRNFTNVSGVGVTVNEVALYVMGESTDDTTRYFMVIRDVIAGGILVPNGQTLTVNYRPQGVV